LDWNAIEMCFHQHNSIIPGLCLY